MKTGHPDSKESKKEKVKRSKGGSNPEGRRVECCGEGGK